MNFRMKKTFMLIMFILVLGLFASVNAQSIANYAYSTATNASLVDMSSGTATLLTDATYHDDVASAVTNIGFTFPFAGSNYTQFSANSNGQLRLGGTVISGTAASIAVGVALFAPMNGDNSIQSSGKLHYKVIGSAPDQILVVEWKHLRINYASETGGTYCTMQALFYETSGRIDYIYGQMNVSATSAQTRTIFFAGSNVAGSVGEIRNIITSFDYVNTFTVISATTFPASSLITNLHSASDGSRRIITFTPTSIPGVVLTSPVNNAQNQALQPTLAWTRWVTPTHYLLYVGTDNPPTDFINGSNIGTVTSYVLPSALANNTVYNWKVVPIYGANEQGTSDQKSFKTLEAPLTGTKTIHPTTGTYTSFTAAIAALNVSGVGAGGVTFNVAAGLTFTESNLNITATGTDVNPIIFQKSGEGANPIIYAGTGTGSTDFILSLFGTDYLTWDGIDLRENAANTTTTTQMEYGLWVRNAAATNGAQNNIFRNFKIVLNRTNTSTRAIISTTPTTPTNQVTGNNNNNEYFTISIENTYVGMWFAGNSTTYFDSGTIVRYCTIGADAAHDIGNGSSITRGIYMTSLQNALIRNNVIRNLSGTSTIYGIDLNSMVGNTNRIFNNKIYNLTNTSTSSTSVMYGIYLSAFTTGTQDFKIYNNMIWNLNHGFTGTATATYYAFGIYVASGGATNTYNIDFNSIRMSTPTNASNAAVYFVSSAGINKLRNNVLANFTGGHATPYHLGIFSASATALGAVGSVSNNNVIHIANSTGGYAVRGSSTNYATIAAWTTASSQDAASRPGNPQFDDANYLYIRTDTPTPVESKGAYLGIDWVAVDIDGQTRHLSTPDIGADEGNFQLEVFCVAPTAQPTNLVTVPYSTYINGSFDAADPVAEKYLVVRSLAAHDTAPTDGVAYAPGNTIGNGTVVQASSGLTFSATGLTAATEYVLTIYSFNDTGIGAPKYYTTGPLTGTRSTLPAAPANPASFAATAYNWQQINLAATANGNTDSIMVAWNTTATFGTPVSNVDYGSNPAITGGGTVIYIGAASGLTNHTGLNELTTYYYKAWSYLTSGEYKVYSSGSTSNATTTMAPLTAPHTQNFDGTFPPAGWTRWTGLLQDPITLTTNTSWIQDDWLNVSGTNKAARLNIWTTSVRHWIISPQFSLPAGNYKLKFDLCLTDYANAAPPDMNGDDDKFVVLVSDDLATWTVANTVREWNNTGSTYVYNNIPHTGTSVLIPLTGISGTKYFAFYGESTLSNADNDLMVDNFQIATLEPYPLAPASPFPALAATNVSPTANLSWTNDGTVTKVDVYFGTNSTLVDALDASVRVATDQTSPLNSYNLPVMSYGTEYFWKVVAKNDNEPVDTATSPLWSFTTMADPSVALPYATDFGTGSTIPTGWTTNMTVTSSTGYGNPPSGIYKYISSPTTVGYANMPQVGPIGNVTALEFDYRYTTSPSTPTAYALTAADQTKILVSTNYGDTFTQYAAINSSNHTTTANWTRKRVILTNLGAVAGDRVIVRFENTFETGASSTHYFQMDNATIFSPADDQIYSMTPTSKDFGYVVQGDSKEQIFTITNNGAVPFTLTDIDVTGDYFSLANVPDPLPTLNYGDIATFKVVYAPGAGGIHTGTLTITDNVSREEHVYTDALTGTGIPQIALPFVENFDSRANVLVEPADSWVIGDPDKTQINNPYSAPACIVTRSLTANANVSENSYVILPPIDVEGITNPIQVKFYQNFYHEVNNDGGEMQYSLDYGTTWTKLEAVVGTGANFQTTNAFNWYNNESTSGPITQPKWSARSNTIPGQQNGWIATVVDIPSTVFSGADCIILRYHFGTDSSTSYEGWAIDDISIYVKPDVGYTFNFPTPPVYPIYNDDVIHPISNNAIPLKVKVTNMSNDATGIDITFKLEGVPEDVVSTGTMAFMETKEISGTYTFPSGGLYDLSVEIDPGDVVYGGSATVSRLDYEVFNEGWLVEGFEGSFLPSRWVQWNEPAWEQTTASFYDGAKAARVTLATDSPGSFLTTPRLSISTGDYLTFWAKSTVADMQLQIRHNDNADPYDVWTALGAPINLTTTFTRYDIDLSSLDGQNERFAFEALPNAIAGTIYLDRVLGPEIYVPTAPPGPVVMLSPLDRAVDVNPKTVVLDWDVPLSGGDPEWYTVIIGFSEDPEILVDNYEDYKVVFAPVSAYQPYTASPSFLMDYDTDYYWMVVPENANGIPTPISSIPVYKLTTQPVPLAGNWTIDPEGTGPTNFTTWTACINYLNAYGVDDGGVTITVANGTYTGPFPAITYNATDTNPVTFVAATGSRDLTTLMAGTGTGETDTIIHLNGADYITFDGFDIIENPANTDATTRMEYGVYVTNNGATDGARNNTIKNCSITLAGTSVTRGVYQLATSVTTAPGSNSYNKYYDNTLLNCWFGYNMVGSSTATAYDVNTEIGGTTAGTITNALQGVAFSYQENIHIYKQSIVLLSGSTPTASPYGIYTNLGGNNSMDAYDNTIYMAANLTASFTVYGISMTAGLNANIYRNVIRDFNVPTTFYGINLTVGSTKQPNYIYDNDIYNITMAGGTYYGINCTATHVNWIYGNELYATTVNGSAYAYPLYIGNSATTNLSHVHTNIIRNITTTGSVYPYHAYLYYGSTNFYNNQIHTCASTSVTYPLYSNLGVTKNIYNNSVYGITQTGTSALYGIYLVSATTQNVYDNRVYNLTGGGTTAGIYANASLTTASTYRIHRNNVSNITYSGTSTSVCYGIYVTGSSTMATVNVYNNMISNLKAPVGTAAATAAQIIGVYYTTAYRFNLWNNSVYLNATSTNANFSTTALQIATQGVGTLADLRNNILVNKSANGTSGRAVAFWKTTANVFTYISAGTDKNIYYAGVPSARNLIYYDTTNNNIQTLAQYKTLLATKDQNAYTEDVPFALTTTDDLHINWTIPTVVEGRAIPITPDVDVDYDVVDARNATTPDIGADEGPFTPLPDVNTPLAQGTNLQTVPGSTFINATFTISDASHYLVVRHTDPTLNTTPVELTRYADGATLGNGIVVSNVSTGVFTASGLSAATQYNFTIFANNQNAVFGPKYLLTDPLTGTRTTLPTAPAAPAVFTASSGGSYQINLIATANGNSDPIMVAWNTVNTFGTPASNVTYSQGSSITGGGTVWYIGAASGLPNHTGLNPSTTYYYRAWSYITSDEYYVFSSSVLDRNATTWAAPVTSYPYNEGFESGFTNGVALGAPYTQVAVSGTGSWTANSTNTTYNRTPRTGSFNATLVYSNSRWLFRPFQLTGGVEYQFKMYARQDMADPSYANMTVAYGNAPTDAAMTNIIVPQTTIINGDYQLLSAAFTPSASGTYMIGIKGTITGTPWYISIDDISLRPTPTAPEPPTGLSPAMAAVNRPISVDLSWNNEGIVTKIDVYFSTDSTAVYTLDSSARVATNQTSPLNSYDLPTLNFSTRYFWQIVCKDNAENQAVSGLYYFNTMADPSLPVPFAENFGTLTALPAGWSMDASSYSGVDATHGRTGSGLYINLYSSIPTFNITMPLIGPLPNYAMLKFDYRIVDYSGYPSTATTLSTGDSVNIMISTNYGATYSRRGSINSTNHVTSTGWATFQVPLVGNGAVVGDRVIIRYSSKWGAGDWYLDIDNVEVTTPPNEQLYGIVPGSYNFGEVQITANSTRQFTVSNSGTVDFDVTSIYVSGGDASLFGVSAAGLPATVGYSTSYNFNVTFTPLTTGPKTTTLYVVDNITGRVEHQYTLTATGIDEFLGTPINLQASVSDYNDVALSWSPVLSSPYVTWSGNSMGNSFRLTGLTSFDAASKFTTTDLAGYRGLKITKVKFFAANEDSAAFRVRIWTGADVNTDPTTMVRDIEVPTYTQNDWNEVTLGTPLTISGTDALWIGYNVVHTATSYPAAIDSGPFVANKGCLYSSGGAWTVSTLGANLMVKAYTRYIEDTREGGSDELMIPVISLASSRIIQAETDPRYAQTRALQGYNVYRNGSQINPTLLTGTTYNDLNVPNGNYDYWVKAVYETGTSNPSNTVTLNINRPAAYTLPFTENWSSGNFTANYWTKVASNWAIGGGTGNPAPAARFNYNPIKYGYNEYLTSWDIDALTYTQVNLKFDVLLDTNTTETLERLAVEVYDGSAWQQIDSFSNTGGDFPWNSKNVDISAHASNRIFQFRFRAYGSDSSTLNYWAIDNIVVEAVTAVEPPVVTISLDVSGYPLLSWDPVAGATSYKVYGCNDPYATFPGLAWEMLSSQPGSTYLHDVDDGFLFFNVTAVVGSREISIPALGPNRQTPVIKTKK